MDTVIDKAALQIADYLSRNPQDTEVDLMTEGKKHILVYKDLVFGPSTPGYGEAMQKMYLDAIRDLSNGSRLLMSYTLGVTYRAEKLSLFTVPPSELGSIESIVGSVTLKKQSDLRKSGASGGLRQDQVNASIYLLICHMSKIFMRQ